MSPHMRFGAARQVRKGLGLARKGLLDRAIECYRRALTLDEGHAFAQLHLARALAAQGRHAEAAAAAQRALALRPREPAFFILAGEALLDSGRCREAADAFAQAVRLSPRNDLARAYLSLARWQRAEEDELQWARQLRDEGLPDSTAFLARLLAKVEEQFVRRRKAAAIPATRGHAPSLLPAARGEGVRLFSPAGSRTTRTVLNFIAKP